MSYGSIDELALAFCTELSVGGLFLETDEPAAPESVVSLQLRLPGTYLDVRVTARVAHARSLEEARASGRRPGMGLQFLDLGPSTLAQLESFIEDQMSRASEEEPAPQATGRSFDVLVVEDDPAYQRIAQAAFSEPGDRVRVTCNGFEALAQVGRALPEVIVSDVNMPRMDGWQLLRLLHAKPAFAAIPVLFTTRLGGEADRLRGYQLGVRDYIAKPFKPAELRARVDRIVAARTPATPEVREAPPPSTGGRRRLRGDLAEVSLPSVLSLFEMEQRTGRVRVLAPDGAERGWLALRGGRPLRASSPPVAGIDAVFALLSAREGEFEFTAADVDGADELGATLSYLLMEHARLRDEGKLP